MELNKTRPGYYILISLSGLMVFLLGSWWLFLVFKLANKLQDLNHPLLQGNLVSMIKWEGITFFILLAVLGITLLYIFLQDSKKTKSMQAFFASLTHELKTPLASMKLQSQVLADHIDDMDLPSQQKEKLTKYTRRLIDDGLRLEDQLDNHLQLSRVERGAPLNLRSINLNNFFQHEKKRYIQQITIEFDRIPNDLTIMADDFALQTIFRNLIENTIRHGNVTPLQALITIDPENTNTVYYTDNGKGFEGNLNLLGKLFYKHNSPQGSGIGIHLIKKLMLQMNGEIIISSPDSLQFKLKFDNEGITNE
jgi:signal transduction histidine kinase